MVRRTDDLLLTECDQLVLLAAQSHFLGMSQGFPAVVKQRLAFPLLQKINADPVNGHGIRGGEDPQVRGDEVHVAAEAVTVLRDVHREIEVDVALAMTGAIGVLDIPL